MKKLVALMFIIAIAGSILILGGKSGTTQAATTPTAPADLIGHWKQTQNGIESVTMSADISDGSILIRMTFADMSNVYWAGSFAPSSTAAREFDTISNADPDKMLGSLYASKDSTKAFNYKNGVLSYSFTMLGKTTTVHLAKGA
jgi:hypothetical protein